MKPHPDTHNPQSGTSLKDKKQVKGARIVPKAARMLRQADDSLWYNSNFPWRTHRNPYRIFLAEFLLVRTRTDVVARIFEDVLSVYPNVESLADADEGCLKTILESLGMLKRSAYLKRAAQYLLEHHNGEIPDSLAELLRVPGMGLYTANAVMAFAFNQGNVPADVNILRFLSRLTGLPMSYPTKGSAELRALLPLLSEAKGGPKAESLLDFTRTICGPRLPKCGICPLTSVCKFYRSINRA